MPLCDTHKGMKETLGARTEYFPVFTVNHKHRFCSSPTTIGYLNFGTRTASTTVANLLSYCSRIASFLHYRPPRKHEQRAPTEIGSSPWDAYHGLPLSSLVLHEDFLRTSFERRFFYSSISGRLHVACPVYTFFSIEVEVSYHA
jgi:hypothetical protein